jgi:DNA repair exonuclease SbcCD nuclease subunit
MTKHFVVFSDLHLHPWAYGSRIVKGRNSRLEQQKEVVQEIANYCQEREIPEVVFTGDLFHTSTVAAETSQAAYEAFGAFQDSKVALSILVGNHDQSSRTGELHSLSFFNEFGQVYDAGAIAFEALRGRFNTTIAGIPAYFFPYTDDEAILRAYLDTARNERCFLFLHQGVGGVEVNSKGFTLNEILTPSMVPSNCAMAFTGHYHSFKPVSNNLIIPGSTVQLNFGDEGEARGWLDVTVDGEQVTEINFIESKASKFITLHEEDFDSNGENNHLPNPLPNLAGNYIRVLSSGAYGPEELSNMVLQFGAVSCEVKPIYKENPVHKTTVAVASLNEIVYSFANAKEKAGIISNHDKEVGEALLKGNYQVPQI